MCPGCLLSHCSFQRLLTPSFWINACFPIDLRYHFNQRPMFNYKLIIFYWIFFKFLFLPYLTKIQGFIKLIYLFYWGLFYFTFANIFHFRKGGFKLWGLFYFNLLRLLYFKLWGLKSSLLIYIFFFLRLNLRLKYRLFDLSVI